MPRKQVVHVRMVRFDGTGVIVAFCGSQVLRQARAAKYRALGELLGTTSKGTAGGTFCMGEAIKYIWDSDGVRENNPYNESNH